MTPPVTKSNAFEYVFLHIPHITNLFYQEVAKKVGEAIAKSCLETGILKVAFDRGGYPYHGRVKALADAARENGLQF